MEDIYSLYFLLLPDLEKAFGCYESSGGNYIFWAGTKERSKGCHFGPCGGTVSQRAEAKVQAGWRQTLFIETADQLVRQKLAERGIPIYGNFMPKELDQRRVYTIPEQAAPIVLPKIRPVQPWAF